MAAVTGNSDNIQEAGVSGTNSVQGGRGVYGESFKGYGVWGFSKLSSGVTGDSENGHGVFGHSISEHGVFGESDNGSGVTGVGHKWYGVYGQGENQAGVFGQSNTAPGVQGNSRDSAGVLGSSDNFEGVHAVTNSAVTAAIAAYNNNPNGTGAALYAKKVGSQGTAGFFEGNVFVTGNIIAKGDILLANADFAEEFDVSEASEAGEVMVLKADGTLAPCDKPYDKKVVGVISGAGTYKPAIILDKQDINTNRKPIAMMGKVYCKVDAGSSPIETGDMLTTSNIPGFAMKAEDPFKAFGAIIGKALASLANGKGLIPVLISLQ